MKKIIFPIVMTIVAIACAILFNSCNVTRTITTTASTYQKGDTTVMVQTKTTESYDATKKNF